MLSIIDRKGIEYLNTQSVKISKSLRVRFCSRVESVSGHSRSDLL
jgi:hypothetical protein